VSGYSFQQLEQAWEQAGGPAASAVTAAAIAEAESGGNPRPGELNSTPPDYSVGPWQINYYGNLYSSRTAAFGPPSLLESNLLDDARAAVSISGGGKDFSPWTEYTNGGYRSYLTGASQGSAGVSGGGLQTSVGSNGSTAQDVSLTGALGADVSGSIRELLLRLGELAGGIILIWLGLRSATSSFNARNTRSQQQPVRVNVRNTVPVNVAAPSAPPGGGATVPDPGGDVIEDADWDEINEEEAMEVRTA
jgi:Lysozyme like domain